MSSAEFQTSPIRSWTSITLHDLAHDKHTRTFEVTEPFSSIWDPTTMSSDYEFSDNDEYYDEDEDMIDEQDGNRIYNSIISMLSRVLTKDYC